MLLKKSSGTMSECVWIGRKLNCACFFEFERCQTCEYCILGGRALIRMCSNVTLLCTLHASVLVLANVGANVLLIACCNRICSTYQAI